MKLKMKKYEKLKNMKLKKIKKSFGLYKTKNKK